MFQRKDIFVIREGRLLASHPNLVQVFRKLETVRDHRASFINWETGPEKREGGKKIVKVIE